MGLLDDLGSLWNDVTGAANMVFHSIDDVISHLGTLGVPFFPSLAQFIQFLVEVGANPFSVLPHLVGVINGRGGNPVEVLEEVASGILSLGPQGFARQQTERVINPIVAQLNTHTQVSQALGTLHQSTVKQVQQKLNALRQSDTGSYGLQGTFALTLDSTFQGVQTNINALTASLGASDSSGADPPTQWYQQTQAAINHAYVLIFEGIIVVAVGLAILDIILLVVEIILALAAGAATVEAGGLGGLVVGAGEALLDAGVIGAELDFIGALILADLALWALFSAIAWAVWQIREQQYHAASSATPLPKAPTLTPEQERLAQDLANKLAASLGLKAAQLVKVLRWLIALLAGAGYTNAQIEAIIRCMSSKGYLGSGLPKATAVDQSLRQAWNAVINHLTPSDLDGAWTENNGGTTKGDHRGEVDAALQALNDLLTKINNRLAYPKITPAERSFYEGIKQIVQKTIDYVNGRISKGAPGPPDSWPDGGVVPFMQDMINQSGCKI
jgi:hypothetical protein